MIEIKTKESVRKEQDGPRKPDRLRMLRNKLKDASMRTINAVNNSREENEATPQEYAEGKIQTAAKDAAGKAGRKLKRGIRYERERRQVQWEETDATGEHETEATTKKTAENFGRKKAKEGKTTEKEPEKRSGRTNGNSSEKTVGLVKNPKRTVQETEKTIKTAEDTAKSTVQSARTILNGEMKAAEASARASRKVTEVVEQAGMAVYNAAMAIGKAVAEAGKAIAAGTSALMTTIGAGGTVALIVIIVLCLIGGVLGSCFGIFASNEKSTGDDSQTMREVILEINQEYQEKLAAIPDSVSYDRLEMSGSQAVWQEVLTIYAVKTNTDPENPQEVATMDEKKKQLLKDIFWEMNTVSFKVKEKKLKETVESVGEDGKIQEREITVTVKYLYLTVDHKSAEEMCEEYDFNNQQKSLVKEMLAMDSSLWLGVLYGVYSADEAIVNVALSQVGNVGGQPYWSWYGFDSRVEWCACFVSWCANQCGYIDAGIIPKYAGCVKGVDWFQSHGQWLAGSATPEAGMIIFFDWDNIADSGPQDGNADHTGIVWKVENGTVYTVEGNSGDVCKIREWDVGNYMILGYGVPQY